MRASLRSLLVPAVVATAAATLMPTIASAEDESANRVTMAVIGDVPYGDVQEATFGRLIDAINTDPKVRRVVHVGDIKNGATTCSEERLESVLTAFETFEDPVVYTPGDNEWTDCHRPAAGGYDPLERLATIRSLFFAEPGTTLGRRPDRVDAQPELVENVRWVQSQVAFATLHVVGSNNGLALWTGHTAPTQAQAAEVADRIDASVQWVDEAFDAAEQQALAGVVLIMQADTFPTGSGHRAIVDRFEYLRLTIDPRAAALFSWERVPMAS
jgi:hypothetical protein